MTTAIEEYSFLTIWFLLTMYEFKGKFQGWNGFYGSLKTFKIASLHNLAVALKNTNS